MKYRGPMLVVKDIEKSKEFYTQVLGVEVISDLGANVTVTGGLSFQTEASWMTFTGCDKDFFKYQGNVVEMYFEEENFEAFLGKIKTMDVEMIGTESEMPWGQKVVRIYDPDKHIVEIGEDFGVMMKRLYNDGITIDELVVKTYVNKEMIEQMLNS